jgi:hypothetical protein
MRQGLDREHARHIARLFKSERLLGSVIERRKVRLKLKGPTGAELLARSSPAPLEVSLYDLLAQFQQALDKAATERDRQPPQLHDSAVIHCSNRCKIARSGGTHVIPRG